MDKADQAECHQEWEVQGREVSRQAWEDRVRWARVVRDQTTRTWVISLEMLEGTWRTRSEAVLLKEESHPAEEDTVYLHKNITYSSFLISNIHYQYSKKH